MELLNCNIYLSSSESRSLPARKTLLFFLLVIINSSFGFAEAGNSRQNDFCRNKWDTCMDIPTRGKYPSAADCDDAIFEKFDCPKPGGAAVSQDDEDRTPAPLRKSYDDNQGDEREVEESAPRSLSSGRSDSTARDADDDRYTSDKSDRVNHDKETTSVDKEIPDDVVRTKDKTVKKKEQIFVKEDMISVEDPDDRKSDPDERRSDAEERRSPPSRGRYSEESYQRDHPRSRHRELKPVSSETEREVPPERERPRGEDYDRRRDEYDEEREKARKAKKDEEELRRLKLERDRLGSFLDANTPTEDDDRSRNAEATYQQDRDRQDYRDKNDRMRDLVDYRDRTEVRERQSPSRDRSVSTEKSDDNRRYDTRERIRPEEPERRAEETSSAAGRTPTNRDTAKKKIMRGEIFTVPVIQSLI